MDVDACTLEILYLKHFWCASEWKNVQKKVEYDDGGAGGSISTQNLLIIELRCDF